MIITIVVFFSSVDLELKSNKSVISTIKQVSYCGQFTEYEKKEEEIPFRNEYHWIEFDLFFECSTTLYNRMKLYNKFVINKKNPPVFVF